MGHEHGHHVIPGEEKQQQKVAWISIIVGGILLLVKFWGYNMTRSEAVYSDAMESIINVTGAILALTVIRIAAKPADEDHPYGHGKAEYFSVAFEGGLIAFASILIIIDAIDALITGSEIKKITEGLFIVLGAGFVNGALGLYLKSSGKKLKSMTLSASGDHILSDFWTSVGIGISLFLVKITGQKWLDPAVAIVVGLQLGRIGYKLVRRSLAGLMDEEDISVLKKFQELFAKHSFPGMIQVHHTRVIRSGRYYHVDAHVVVPEFWDVKTTHDETIKFDKTIMSDDAVEGEIHFHVDPCRRVYCKVCEFPDCPVRVEPFEHRQPVTLEQLRSPDEPEEFKE